MTASALDGCGRVIQFVGHPGGQRAQLHHALILPEQRVGVAPVDEDSLEQRAEGGRAAVEQLVEVLLADDHEPGRRARADRRHARRFLDERQFAENLARLANGQQHVAAAGCLGDLQLALLDDVGPVAGAALFE